MSKEWAWSFSKLKNFEVCPKKHHEVDIAKNYKDESEQLTWGNKVHTDLAAAIVGKAKLPLTMEGYQKWVDWVAAIPGHTLVEQRYAITRDFAPREWFDHSVWYRGVADVVKLQAPFAVALDWKTGSLLMDSVQLALMAQCIFSHFPDIHRVRTEYVWLKDDTTTGKTFKRSDMAGLWAGLLPRVKAYEHACHTLTFEPKPSGLCRRHCPVLSCVFHGKGARQ